MQCVLEDEKQRNRACPGTQPSSERHHSYCPKGNWCNKEKSKVIGWAHIMCFTKCNNTFSCGRCWSLPEKETLARMVRQQRITPDGNINSADELKVTMRGEPFVACKDDNLEIVTMTTAKNLEVLEANYTGFMMEHLIQPLTVSSSTLFMPC